MVRGSLKALTVVSSKPSTVCTCRWLSVRLELIGTLVTFTVAVLLSTVLRVSPGLAGLALTSALDLTSLMNWMVPSPPLPSPI